MSRPGEASPKGEAPGDPLAFEPGYPLAFDQFNWVGQRVVLYGNPIETADGLVGYVQRLGPAGVELVTTDPADDGALLQFIPFTAIRAMVYFPKESAGEQRRVRMRTAAHNPCGQAPGR